MADDLRTAVRQRARLPAAPQSDQTTADLLAASRAAVSVARLCLDRGAEQTRSSSASDEGSQSLERGANSE